MNPKPTPLASTVRGNLVKKQKRDLLFKPLFIAQGEKCAICGTTETTQWVLDHDHRCNSLTKKGRQVNHQFHRCSKCIRAVLCHHCNLGLGHFKENISLLAAAINYLNIHKDKDFI